MCSKSECQPLGAATGGSSSVPGAGGTGFGTGGTGFGTGGTGSGGTPPVTTGGSDQGGSGGSIVGQGGTGMASPMGSITVNAGDKNRDRTIVHFPYPQGAGRNLVLNDGQGGQIPLQVRQDGRGIFVLPSLAAGAQATFMIEELAQPLPNAVSANEEGGHLFLDIGQTRVFRNRCADPM